MLLRLPLVGLATNDHADPSQCRKASVPATHTSLLDIALTPCKVPAPGAVTTLHAFPSQCSTWLPAAHMSLAATPSIEYRWTPLSGAALGTSVHVLPL